MTGSAVDQQLILDRYRPLEQLGTGGFGAVVLAWDTRMQRRVAIKRMDLPLDSRGNPHQPPGLAEARTAAMLGHPSIVTVFDFDADSDEAFIIMEHVDGVSLAEVLDRIGGPLDPDEAAAVLSDVLGGVDFAHRNGVLHLDLKPANILIDRSGRAKVADFGMAELSSLAGHGSAFGGTDGYMPFEQMEGERVSERTDEWALGVVAFECLTGVNPALDRPADASSLDTALFDLPLASRYDRDLAGDIEEVLATATAARAADRYENVASFSADLLPLLGDPEIGRESLAEVVHELAGGEEDESELLQTIGLWDRLHGRAGSLLVRGLAGTEAGWLAWMGFTPWGLQSLPLAGAVALVVLAAVLAPSLGVGLGMAAFASGFAATGSWLVAGLLAVAVIAWWWFVARRSSGAAVLPLAGPLLGIARVAPATPLLAGFALRPPAAAASALAAGAMTMLASAGSARTVPYLDVWPPYVLDVWGAQLSTSNVQELTTSAAALVALLAWPVSAAVTSWFCNRATRGWASIGVLAGAALLVGGYLLADEVARLTGKATGWSGPAAALALGASLILVVLVVALGAPVRAEEDVS